MENASKALIIAGAILISILLISVGVLIINGTQSATGGVASQSDTMAIQMFNSQFTSFEGGGNRTAQISSLRSKVNASNAEYPDHQVTLSTPTSMNSKKTYGVSLDYDAAGYVSTITVTEE